MQVGISVNNQYKMANSVDPDDPSHQDLQCLQRYLVRSAGAEGINYKSECAEFYSYQTTVRRYRGLDTC